MNLMQLREPVVIQHFLNRQRFLGFASSSSQVNIKCKNQHKKPEFASCLLIVNQSVVRSNKFDFAYRLQFIHARCLSPRN